MSSFASDEQFVGLIRKEQTGTALQEQVSRLFEEARDDVYRYLLTLGLYPPQAQEATQEVFLRLYATLRKGEAHPEPARVDFPGGAQSGAENSNPAAFRGAIRPGNRANRVQHWGETPESELLDRERMTRFHSAVKGLSEQQRRCLFLRMEGLRYPEIGATLGISASAVGEFLRRAMVRLRKVRDE